MDRDAPSPAHDPLLGAQRTVALLEKLIESAPVGLALFDARGCYLHVNEVLSQINGVAAAAHLGRTIAEVLPEMTPVVGELLDQVIQTGGDVVAREITGRTPATPHEDRSWLLSFFPVRPDPSAPLVIGAVVLDITDRRRGEEERAALLATAQDARATAEGAAVRLARLQHVTAALSGAIGTRGVADAVFYALRETMGAQGSGVWGLEELSGDLVIEASSAPLRTRVRVPADAPLPTTDVLRTGEPLFLLSRAQRLQRWPEAVGEGVVEAVAVLPLRVADRLGVLGVWFGEERDFTTDDREFMVALARQCGQALERGRLYDQARLALEALNRLQRVASQLVSVDQMEELTSVIVGDASEAVGATAGYLALLDGAGTHLELVASRGYPAAVADRPPLAIDAPMPLSEAVRTNTAVWVPSPECGADRWPATVGEPVDPRAYVVLPLSADGEVLGAMGYSWPGDRVLASRDMVELTTLADQCAQALVRIRLHEAEQRARRSIEFLAKASRHLTSLEYDETLTRALELIVPEIADGCALFAIKDGSALELFGSRGISPEIERAAASLASGAALPSGLLEVARSGISQLWRDVTADIVRAMADQSGLSPAAREQMDAIGIRSVMTVPVMGRRRALGVLSLAATGCRRQFDTDDVAAAEDLGRRVGIALENALLYAAQVEVASTLQRSLLPPSLPDADDLEFAARYRPAGEGTEVGGDFYDVFRRSVPDGSGAQQWIVMVGDVVGTGPRAAAITALVRHTVRAVSGFLGSPAEMAAAVNGALVETDRSQAGEWSERFCTLALGSFRRNGSGWDVELISGGHPPALVLRDGAAIAESLAARGLLIGQFADARWEPVRVHLSPGDTLVLYTDGVTEARRSGSATRHLFGETRLAETVAAGGSSAVGIAGAIEEAVRAWTGGAPTDDVAILVVRAASAVTEPDRQLGEPARGPAGEVTEQSGRVGGGAVRSSAPGAAIFNGDVREAARSLPPDPRSVAEARHAVSLALTEWGVDPDITERVALIVTELVTNSILHAATPVGLTVQWDGVAVRLEVADGSAVRPAPAAADDGAVTGRGLSLVEAMSDAWGAEAVPHGKTVWAVVGGDATGTVVPQPTRHPGSLPVVLMGVPIALFRALTSYDDSVLRELELLAIGPASGSPEGVPPALRDLVHRARAGFVALREPFRRVLDDAPLSGTADIELFLSESVPAGLRRYVELLERVEGSLGVDRFLVDEPSAEIRRLRAWVAAEIGAQIDDGRSPTPFTAS